MWIITTLDGNVLGSSFNNNRDTIDASFCLYNAPNEVVWVCREPTSEFIRIITFNKLVELIVFRDSFAGGPLQPNINVANMLQGNSSFISFRIKLYLTSVNWVVGKSKRGSGLEMRLIPMALRKLKSSNQQMVIREGHGQILSIDHILKYMCRKLGINYLSSQTLEEIEYHDFYFSNSPIEDLIGMCRTAALEWYCDGETLSVGNSIVRTDEGMHYYRLDINTYSNTIFTNRYVIRNLVDDRVDNKYMFRSFSGGLKDSFPLPGRVVQLGKEYGENDKYQSKARIVYSTYKHDGTKGGGTCTFLTTDHYTSESMLYEMLPVVARNIYSMENRTTPIPPIIGQIIGSAGTKEEKDKKVINTNVEFSHNSLDETILLKGTRTAPLPEIPPQWDGPDEEYGDTKLAPDHYGELAQTNRIRIPEGTEGTDYYKYEDVFNTTPFAGKWKGITFPDDDGATVVTIRAGNKMERSCIVGRIQQQGEILVIQQKDDYRFTLEDGATDYYSNYYDDDGVFKYGEGWIRSVPEQVVMGVDKDIRDTIRDLAGARFIPTLASQDHSIYVSTKVHPSGEIGIDLNDDTNITVNINGISIVNNAGEYDKEIFMSSENDNIELKCGARKITINNSTVDIT